MSFIKEFAEYLIRKNMEDPEERDRKMREHVQKVKAKCETVKKCWAHPVKPYGYWTFDRNNAKYHTDLKMSQVNGRRDPFDTVPS